MFGSVIGMFKFFDINIFIIIILFLRRQKEKRINPDSELSRMCTSPTELNSDANIDGHFAFKPNPFQNYPTSVSTQGLDLKIKVTPTWSFTPEKNERAVCSYPWKLHTTVQTAR